MVPVFIVTKCIDYIKRPPTNIIKALLDCGVFPDGIKTVKVVPIQKPTTNLDSAQTDQQKML